MTSVRQSVIVAVAALAVTTGTPLVEAAAETANAPAITDCRGPNGLTVHEKAYINTRVGVFQCVNGKLEYVRS